MMYFFRPTIFVSILELGLTIVALGLNEGSLKLWCDFLERDSKLVCIS